MEKSLTENIEITQINISEEVTNINYNMNIYSCSDDRYFKA